MTTWYTYITHKRLDFVLEQFEYDLFNLTCKTTLIKLEKRLSNDIILKMYVINLEK